MYYNSLDDLIFVSKVNTPNLSLLLGMDLVDFGGGVLLLLLVVVVVVVTGAKQSQLLDIKSWSRSGV